MERKNCKAAVSRPLKGDRTPRLPSNCDHCGHPFQRSGEDVALRMAYELIESLRSWQTLAEDAQFQIRFEFAPFLHGGTPARQP
jgi:hypothetical protein